MLHYLITDNGSAGNGLSVILRCYQPVLTSKFIRPLKSADCLRANINV